MTPGRFILILVVVVLVAFGVSLALLRKNSRDPQPQSNPTNSWVNDVKTKLMGSQRFNVEKDFSSTCRQGRLLSLPQGLPTCSATLTNSADKQIKELRLTLIGADAFELHYAPLKNGAETVDRGAVSVNLTQFEPNKPLKLIILPHGGKLTLLRKGGLGQATVKLE